MTAALGGGYHYESAESRALSGFAADKFAYRDQGKNLIQLNNAVGFMSGMMRKMQRGIDDANKNFVQQIQGFITDFIVMLGGGGDTGLDFGDLKYVIQAIGALFGFADENGNLTVPVNLFNAAWHFFSNYIGVTGNFRELIDQLIDNAIATVLDLFGEVPIVGQALQQFAALISDIRDLLDPIAEALQAFLEAFDIQLDDIQGIADFFGPFKPIVEALMTALDGINLPDFTETFHMIAQWSTPFVRLIAAGITLVATFIGILTGAKDGSDLTEAFKALSLAFDPEANGGDGYNAIEFGIGIIQHVLDPTGLLGGLNWGDLASKLFGVGGITDGNAFGAIAANFLSFLGNPSFASGGFNPITAAADFLKKVLTPAGALSSWTQIPQHLLGNLNFGRVVNPAYEDTIYNLLPDPSCDDPMLLEGGGAWVWDAKDHTGKPGSGSFKTTGAGIVRQLIGVPIGTKAGDVTDFGAYVYWDNVAASAGQTITLVASSYDANDNLIPDSKRVVAAIGTPGATSVGFSGVDAVTGKTITAASDGWVHLVGSHSAPAGTVNVRITLEVQSNVSAGNIYYDDLLQSIRGPLDASLLGNIANIPNLLPFSVDGFGGLIDMVTTFQHMLDGLGSAYNPNGSVSGLDFTDLFTLAQTQTNAAVTALEQAIRNTLQLGNRTNKATSAGVNPTSEAMFTIGHFSAGGNMTTSTIASGTAISQTFRAAEAATKGFFEFVASGSGMTDVRVNVFLINPTTKARTALWNSPNIATLIPSVLGYVRALIPQANQPHIAASDLLQLEIVNNSANALTVVTKATAIPNHPTDFPTNVACTRVIGSTGGATPSALTDGQVTYSGTVPYVNFGILDVPADYHAPQVNNYTAAGVYNLTLPAWLGYGDEVDILGIGGGGGGGGSFFYITGQGGGPSQWAAGTLRVGIDILAGSTMTLTVGNRGAGGPGNGAQNGSNGGNSIIQWRDINNVLQTATIIGGPFGGSGSNGHNPANSNDHSSGMGATNVTWNGTTYFGGADVGSGNTGQSPGGGGGGSIPYGNGMPGGVGQIVVRFEQVL